MRTGGTGRWPSFIVLGTVVAIAVASLKPWSAGAPHAPVTTRASAADAAFMTTTRSAVPEPTATAAWAPDPTSILCYTRRAWRVVALEKTASMERRSWLAALPAFNASGPADPRIDYVRLFTPGAVGVGVCVADASVGGPATLSELTVTLWRRQRPDRYVRLPSSHLLSSGSDRTSVLLAAPGSAGSELAPWATGRYVLRLYEPGSWAVWFGVEIVQSRQPTDRP